jgi:hypothetical protein
MNKQLLSEITLMKKKLFEEPEKPMGNAKIV